MKSMTATFETTQTAGPDGLVHLSIPVPRANQAYHLVVQFKLSPQSTPDARDERGWPVGYFEEVPGSWEGEFPELYEGDFEKRMEL